MKKFLLFLLFVLIAGGLMFTYGDEIRDALPLEGILPTVSTTASGTKASSTATTAGGGTTGNPTAVTTAASKPPVTPPAPGAQFEGDYYYTQLTENSQKVYTAILENPQKTDGIPISLSPALSVTVAAGESENEAKLRLQALLLSTIQPALDALAYDHPEIDWIRMGDGGGSTFRYTVRTGSGTVYTDGLTFDLVCEEREGGIAAHSAALSAAIADVEVTGESRYELLLAIQKAICERTVYTLDGVYAHDAAGVLLKGEAVCDGYAKSFKLLCDKYDIPCIIVAGTAVQSGESEAHAWNYVQMEDGAWYAVDVTWNDKEGRDPSTAYFLVGAETVTSLSHGKFSESHIASGHFSSGSYEPFVFPTLAQDAYEDPDAEEDPFPFPFAA